MNDDEYAINDRVAEIITKLGLTNKAFAESIDVLPSSISQLLAKRNKPGLDFIQKLIVKYDIDANWLITGKDSTSTSVVKQKESPKQTELFTEEAENQPEIDVKTLVAPSPAVTRKTIEKIVVFYTDKTFSESYPE